MNTLLRFCIGLPETSFDAGTVLIAEDGGRGPLIILVEGGVRVARGDMEVSRCDTPGTVFGEISGLLDIPNTASVIATSEVRAVVVENSREFLESHPKIAFHIASLLADRLHKTTDYLVAATSQVSGADDPIVELTRTIEAIAEGRRESTTP